MSLAGQRKKNSRLGNTLRDAPKTADAPDAIPGCCILPFLPPSHQELAGLIRFLRRRQTPAPPDHPLVRVG